MCIDTKNLINVLENSNDKEVTMDKDFFIQIVKGLDSITSSIKVEELFNPNKRVKYVDINNTTIINSGELLSEDYKSLTGEVKVEATELKALLKENVRQRKIIKDLEALSERLEQQIRQMYSNKRDERIINSYNPYNNSFRQDIKVSING